MANVIGGVRAVSEVVPSGNIWDSILFFGIILIVIGLVVFGVILITKWLVKKKTRVKDIYEENFKNTIGLCKLHRNTKYLHSIMGLPLWLMSNGVKIYVKYPRVNYTKEHPKFQNIGEDQNIFAHNQNGAQLLGTYAGSCYTSDGCFNILIKSAHQKVMFFFPKVIILKLRHPHKQKVIDPKNADKTKILDIPPDSYFMSEDIIIIESLGLTHTGQYHYVINQGDNGYLIDTKPFVYNDMIDIATQKQVIDFGQNSTIMAENWVRGNPLIQFVRKTDSGITQE